MKLNKIIAAFAAAAVAAATMAVSAFAVNIPMDTENGGAWALTKTSIPKADLEAIGGDVKITLNIEIYDPYGLADQFLLNPIDVADSWISQTDKITSDSITAKNDGWICVNKNATTVEFVMAASDIAALADGGLYFQTQNVTVLSADIEAGSPQGELTRVDDEAGKEYCFADLSASSADAPAADASADAPASDSATTSSGTGNTASAVIVSVMAVAGAAALASRKRK